MKWFLVLLLVCVFAIAQDVTDVTTEVNANNGRKYAPVCEKSPKRDVAIYKNDTVYAIYEVHRKGGGTVRIMRFKWIKDYKDDTLFTTQLVNTGNTFRRDLPCDTCSRR